MIESIRNKSDNPCKGCLDRYPGCSDNCKKPALLSWRAEQERIKKNRQKYTTPIWTHGDRDPRRK